MKSMEVTQPVKNCEKCGGMMVEGRLVFPSERMSSQTINPMTPSFGMTGFPNVVEDIVSEPRWEEKTGEKVGFIFKRDEVKQMKLESYRCSLCNFIELYAKPK